MTYSVLFKKKVLKNIKKLPASTQKKLVSLIDDLKRAGPIRPNWPNFSKLGKDEYHCHLSRSWVVCWRHKKNDIIIEIYYVGSRENTPY